LFLFYICKSILFWTQQKLGGHKHSCRNSVVQLAVITESICTDRIPATCSCQTLSLTERNYSRKRSGRRIDVMLELPWLAI